MPVTAVTFEAPRVGAPGRKPCSVCLSAWGRQRADSDIRQEGALSPDADVTVVDQSYHGGMHSSGHVLPSSLLFEPCTLCQVACPAMWNHPVALQLQLSACLHCRHAARAQATRRSGSSLRQRTARGTCASTTSPTRCPRCGVQPWVADAPGQMAAWQPRILWDQVPTVWGAALGQSSHLHANHVMLWACPTSSKLCWEASLVRVLPHPPKPSAGAVRRVERGRLLRLPRRGHAAGGHVRFGAVRAQGGRGAAPAMAL